MTPSARSVFAFGIYLVVLALALLFSPNVLLEIFGLAPTSEVWIRVVGMLVGLLSVYYITAARHEWTPFFHVTVYARSSVMIFFAVFVLFDLAETPLLLFGLVDVLGAAWTTWELRRRRPGRSSKASDRRSPAARKERSAAGRFDETARSAAGDGAGR